MTSRRSLRLLLPPHLTPSTQGDLHISHSGAPLAPVQPSSRISIAVATAHFLSVS